MTSKDKHQPDLLKTFHKIDEKSLIQIFGLGSKNEVLYTSENEEIDRFINHFTLWDDTNSNHLHFTSTLALRNRVK